MFCGKGRIFLLYKNVLEELKSFRADSLREEHRELFEALCAKAKDDALRMIRNANSGHVGGSMSSAESLAMLLLCADIDNGDRVIVSHGHIAPIYYALLGNLGYFDVEDAVRGLRRGGIFEGHPSVRVNGVTWCSGMLGQGLSVGAGFALANKLRGKGGRISVIMGDGEQQKGQILEGARFAVKYGLSDLTCVVDLNRLQASGTTEDIMPLDIGSLFRDSGFAVREINGHCPCELYEALKEGSDSPKLILACTTMGRGIPEAEGDFRYHGALPQSKLLDAAQNDFRKIYIGKIPKFREKELLPVLLPEIECGDSIAYEAGMKYACRDAAAAAVLDIFRHNKKLQAVVLDCDLIGSMKLEKFKKEFPHALLECGIAEQNAVSAAAGLAKNGVLAFLFNFGVLSIDEVFSQLRMAEINGAPLKIIATHCGLDVGEDGKTHQCTDYIGMLSHLFGAKVFVPADANQTDAAVRFMANEKDMCVLTCGRSAVPVIADDNGNALYAGKGAECLGATVVREGADAAVITCGTLLHKAVAVSDRLREKGVNVRVVNACEPLNVPENVVLNAARTGILVTYEDHNVRTGLGGSVAEILAGKEVCVFVRMGIKAHGGSAAPDKLYEKAGLDEESLYRTICSAIQGRRDKVIGS